MKFVPITAILIFVLSNHSFAQNIRINEFMSSNNESISDEDGDYVDWIELYNPTAFTTVLNGYTISDNANNPMKWTIPTVAIEPHSFLLIFASGKDRSDVEGELHTNFKIKSGGEVLVLSNSLHEVVDSMLPMPLEGDNSYGRLLNGSDNLGYLIGATPGFSNNGQDFFKEINFSKTSGFYTSDFYLTLSCDDSIYYTMDGSIPTVESELYTGSFLVSCSFPNKLSLIPTNDFESSSEFGFKEPKENVNKAVVLRAVSIMAGEKTSKIYSKTYFTNSVGYSIPVLSLSTDSVNLFDHNLGIYVPGASLDPYNIYATGNYNMRGIEWEREANMELFNSKGQSEFSEAIGIRISGNRSRNTPQKSLRFYFRNDYGKSKINYSFFPERDNEEYKRIVLRSSFSYWWKRNTLFQDEIIHSIIAGSKSSLDVQMATPVVLFINGEYWGLQTFRERQDKYYLAYTHNVDKDKVDIIGGNLIAEEGSSESFAEVIEFVENNNMSNNDNYEYIAAKIGVDNFIDYYIFETYFGNRDWPANNVRLWRSQEEEGKWKCLFYDMDGAIGDVNSNPFEVAGSLSNMGLLFAGLTQNETFNNKFVSKYVYYLKTAFHPDRISDVLDNFMRNYATEVPEHINRWNSPYYYDSWTNSCDYFRDFMDERPCLIKGMLIDYFDLENLNEFDCMYLGDADFIRVFPNPSSGVFNLVFENAETIRGQVNIYNSMGQIVYSQTLMNLNKQTIDVSFLINGVYYVQVDRNGKLESEKIIISK